MLLFFVLLSGLLTNYSNAIEVCINGTYCRPKQLQWKMDSAFVEKEPAPIVLERNADPSGCTCRHHPAAYVVCFGAEDGCKSFPRSLRIQSNTLRVTLTQIKALSAGDLQHLRHLTSLQIENNFHLAEIQRGSFRNMSAIENLSISYNSNLRALQNGSFEGLVRLRELFLVKNGFYRLYNVTIALSTRDLPTLQTLSLSVNSFGEVHPDDFSPMTNSSVEALNLVTCTIAYIHPDAFLPLRNLQELGIGENSINPEVIAHMINRTVNSGIPLKKLSLHKMSFRRRPPYGLLSVIAHSNITYLSLAENQFEGLNRNSFPHMPKLLVLDLRDDLILNITNDAFENLPNLRTLELNRNRLGNLPEGVLLENLTYLDMQENSGTFTYSSSYFTVYKNRFSHMKQLKYLNLSYNRLNVIYNSTFAGLQDLEVLGLRNGSIHHIANASFVELKKLVYLNLENNYFLKNRGHALEADIFQGLERLEVLELGGTNIMSISIEQNPFKYLVSLKFLNLENNKLSSLNANIFRPLINLESVDLSKNWLTSWNIPVFPNNKNLLSVRLAKNKIAYLTESMYEDFTNLTSLQIDENPFVCDCRSFNYFTASPKTQLTTTFLDQDSTLCVFPEIYSNLTVGQYWKLVGERKLCKTDAFLTLILLLPLAFLFLITILTIFLIYYYRWHIRYWIFLTRLYLSRRVRIRPAKESKQPPTAYEYDAFVSYSNEDRNFVIRLVAMLENYEPFLKLCVFERDFQIGTVISDSVLESVAKSRKTLLIISDNYAKSQWCRWESQIAEHHRLFLGNERGEYVDDTLVLIKLGPINGNHLTPTLKYLLKTRIYLAWESSEKRQKVFWEKLRSVLAPLQQFTPPVNTHM